MQLWRRQQPRRQPPRTQQPRRQLPTISVQLFSEAWEDVTDNTSATSSPREHHQCEASDAYYTSRKAKRRAKRNQEGGLSVLLSHLAPFDAPLSGSCLMIHRCLVTSLGTEMYMLLPSPGAVPTTLFARRRVRLSSSQLPLITYSSPPTLSRRPLHNAQALVALMGA